MCGVENVSFLRMCPLGASHALVDGFHEHKDNINLDYLSGIQEVERENEK